jgi:hypothetical protein
MCKLFPLRTTTYDMGAVLGVKSRDSQESPRTATRRAVHTLETLDNNTDPPRKAMRRALHTPEVLEMILLQVDMRTLLTSGQRVCYAWTNLIRTSRSLQRALFFMPIQESEWAAGEKTLNPLLAEVFPSIFPAKYDECDEKFSIRELPMAKDAEAMAIFGPLDASWRRMLVQQPPLSDIGVLHVRHTRVGNRVKRSHAPVGEVAKAHTAQPNPSGSQRVLEADACDTGIYKIRTKLRIRSRGSPHGEAFRVFALQRRGAIWQAAHRTRVLINRGANRALCA